MSASALVATTPAIHVVSADSRKTTVLLQAMPEQGAAQNPRPRVSSGGKDYFNPYGNRNTPDILQERAALERIAYAFSKTKD